MTGRELMRKLMAMPPGQLELPVAVEDGMNPSDLAEAREIIVRKGNDLRSWFVRNGESDYIEIL